MNLTEIFLIAVSLVLLIVSVKFRSFRKQVLNDKQDAHLIRNRALKDIVELLPSAAMIVDTKNHIVTSNSVCVPLRLISDDRISVPEIRSLNEEVVQTKTPQTIDQLFLSTDPSIPDWEASVIISPIDEKHSLVLINDLSEERRLNEVRRDFVANVSHELKTPVGALSLLAEAITAAGNDEEQIKKFTSRMQLEVKRLTELITDLVELSEVQGDKLMRKFEPVNLVNVINEAVDVNKLFANEKNMNINVGQSTSSVFVLGDNRQLVTALSNLISNAIRYSPTHTNVGVGLRVEDHDALISVTDQGAGISEENQVRIFERFYRVDPARSRETGGTGLGLAIVKYICANHGGECTVWSREGQGSTFTLRLPIYSGENSGGTFK